MPSIGSLLGTIRDTVWTATPEDIKKKASEVYDSVIGNTPPPPPSFGTAMTTFSGYAWNGVAVPAQGATAAAGNFIIIHSGLDWLVNPEPGGLKDVSVKTTSVALSAMIGYGISESIGYSEVPHFNPGYDSKWISLIAALAGSALALGYTLHAKRPRDEAPLPWYINFIPSIFRH